MARFQSFCFGKKRADKKPQTENSADNPFDLEQIQQENLAEAAENSTALVDVPESENRNTGRSCRVTVEVLAAKELRNRVSGINARDPYFKLRVEKVSRKTSQKRRSFVKNGVFEVNQHFTFDVKDPKTAGISMEVFDRRILGIEVFLGAVELPVVELLKQNIVEKEGRIRWYDLFSKDGKKKLLGQVLMDVVAYIAEPEQIIRAFVGTWNVGNSCPASDLCSWLPTNSFYEVVAIGAQECDYQPRAPFSECGKDWLQTLKFHLGTRYRVVQATSRGQIRLAVFVRDDAERAIGNVYRGSEATGVGHVMPNKGGLCIAFKFWDTRLCFVNAHFAAHVGHCSIRNSNYREIVSQLRVGVQSMDILSQFHHVFWLGDLNYRLDLKSTEEGKLRNFLPWPKVVEMIEAGDLKELLQHDELSREIAASRVLYKFKEGEITFAPTFKMEKENIQTYSQKRTPAWCDRVLWRSLDGLDVELLSYNSSPNIMSSDHKPVAATFSFLTYSLPSFNPSSLAASEDGKRWHIRFMSLRGKNLRVSDTNGSSDPYVTFLGPIVMQEFRSKVKHNTLNPVWDPRKDLPTLVLNPLPLRRLEREHLMVKVLDFDYTSTDDSLGFTVIPIAPAVAAFKRGPQENAYFNVELLHHGLPTGTLEGDMKLTCETNFLKRKLFLANTLVRKTFAAHNSFKNLIVLRHCSS